MENYEVTEKETTEVTAEPEYGTETLNYEEKGVSLKDAAIIGAVTLTGAAVVKWLGKKLKPVFVKKAAKFVKKNGYTVVPNELLDSEEDEVEAPEEISVEED